MNASDLGGATNVTGPNYSKLREYLITAVQRDLEAAKPAP
jgi:hypothetical protein